MSFEALSDWSALLSLPSSLSTRWQRSRWPAGGRVFGGADRSARSRPLAGTGTLLASVATVPELSGAAGGLAATAGFLGPRWRQFRGLDVPVRAPAIRVPARAAAGGQRDRVSEELAQNLGPVFAGPGLPLLLSSAFAAALLGLEDGEWPRRRPGRSGSGSRRRGAVLTFVLAGQVVASSGAAAILASGATVFGGSYPAVAPVIGHSAGGSRIRTPRPTRCSCRSRSRPRGTLESPSL